MTHQSTEGRESKSYGAIMRRWFWLILLLVVVTVAMIYYRSFTAPPVYQASVTLQVIAQEPEEVALFTPIRGTGTEEQIRAVRGQFVSILQSTTIAWRTVGELDLNISARQLLEDITVRQEDEFITVMARAVGPQAAEALVSTHVNQALEYYRQVRSRPVETAEQFIAEQLQDSKEELAEAEKDFLEFKLKHKIGSLHKEISALQDVIRALSQKRDEVRVEIERSLALAAEMENGAAEALKLSEEAKAEAQQAEEVLKRAEEAEAEAEAEAGAEAKTEAEIESPEATETPENVEEAEARAEEAGATADHYLGVAYTFETSAINYAAATEAARTAEAEYGQIIANREAGLVTLIGLGAEYDTLENNLQQARERVSFLAGKANEAEIKKSQALAAGYLQIIEPAHTPGSPMPSNTWQLMALGAVVSLIVGMILAFLLEILTGRRRRAPLGAGRARQPTGGEAEGNKEDRQSA